MSEVYKSQAKGERTRLAAPDTIVRKIIPHSSHRGWEVSLDFLASRLSYVFGTTLAFGIQ
jgi:hypothetical protein